MIKTRIILYILIEICRVITITGDSVGNFPVISASRLKLYFSSIYATQLVVPSGECHRANEPLLMMIMVV